MLVDPVEMSKKSTPLWREAHFQVKMHKTPQLWTTFGSCDVEKVQAVVARSTFRSQHVKKKNWGWDHFWRFRCASAWQAQGIVGLVKSEQNVRVLQHFQLQPPLHHITLQYTTLQLQCSLQSSLHSTTLGYTTFHYTPLHYTQLHSMTLHYTTPHYTTLHYTTLHSTTLHYTTLLPLHYTTLHYTTLHYTTLHYTTLH